VIAVAEMGARSLFARAVTMIENGCAVAETTKMTSRHKGSAVGGVDGKSPTELVAVPRVVSEYVANVAATEA
jgi:hypothetical protein